MNITVPLVKLIPLWIADLRVKRKPNGEPYSEDTLDRYAKRANKGFLSLDCAPTKASFKQYFDEEQKLVDFRKMASRTLNFEESALNGFFGWLLANNLIKEHPNPNYKLQEVVKG